MDKEQKLIHEFAEKMYKKIELRRDRYVPLAWQRMDTKRLLKLLKEEIAEFEEENSPDEAVDIANYALFLWFLVK